MSNKEVKTKYSYSSVKLRRIVFGCLGLMLFILFVAYLCISQYYKEHFYAKTYINGMDCSNLTAEEATDVITRNINEYVLTISARDGSTQEITGEDINLTCTFDKDLSDVLDNQSAYSWLSNALKNNEVDNPYQLNFDEDKLSTLIKNLDCMAEDKQVAPTNAKVSKYNKTTGFTVIKEDQGNKLVKKSVTKTIKDAVNSLTTTISLEEKECYKKPTVTSDSQVIAEAMETINKYMSTELTYKFGDKTEVLDAKTIGPALSVDKNYKVNINQAKLKEYVTYLGKKYTTAGGSWKFKTSYGTTTTVKGGDYGWKLNETEELKEIVSYIKKGKQKNKKPVSAIEGMEYGKYEIGDTYVEVNLTHQRVFYYKNGKKILESSCVTGNTSAGNGTPAGVYSVQWKQRNRTLRGRGYATPVKYWMPFNGGIGLHDAWWRGSFGGSIYKYNGSHGCVNLPSSVAARLYANLAVNTPVVVYH